MSKNKNEKRFVFLMATPSLTVECGGNETAEFLITKRFPPTNAMHEEVKRFCKTAKAGDFLQTTYNFIFCCDDGNGDIPIPTTNVHIDENIPSLTDAQVESMRAKLGSKSQRISVFDVEEKAIASTDALLEKCAPKKVYIAGKITGLDYNETFKKFERAEIALREQGFEPINPMKKPSEQKDKSWSEYMCEDMHYLFGCDAIFLLSDWFDSKGARIEFAIARELELDILFDNGETQIEQYKSENEKLRTVIASKGRLL